MVPKLIDSVQNLLEKKRMLKEKDKIFTNLYGYGKWNLEGAKSRGIWSNTDKLIAFIVTISVASLSATI